MSNKAKIRFCSGVGSVTGANFLLTSPGGTNILVDCGLIQGDRVAMSDNALPFSYDASTVTALIVTHAHLDHVGRIPKLVKEGFKGKIISTPETRELAELVLNDAVGILKMEADQEGIEPLYNSDDVRAIFPLWQTLEYHRPLSIGEDLVLTFKDAGHILGSAMAEITVKDGDGGYASQTKVVFTGDLGNSPAPLLRDTEPLGDADFLVMESVYGDRNHESKEDRVEILAKIVRRAVDRGGTLVIPAFSIDRTQTLLYELNDLVNKGKIPSVPVFVDSPMAIRATEIYKSGSALFNQKIRDQIAGGDDIFRFPNLKFTVSGQESKTIDEMAGAKIILAGSGMSVGGRVIGHEERFLPDPKNTLLLTGYQSAGSLGRQLADGAKKVRIHGRTIKVKAKVETMYGFSAHKDSDHLVEFVSTGTERLRQVFVVMGEPGSAMHLAQRINDELGVKAIVPEVGKEYVT